MAKLVFDASGDRFFSTGVHNVALSVVDPSDEGTIDNGKYQQPVAWNGITSISNSPEGGEANELYADNIKYLDLMSAEKLGGTIEAYQAPVEFDACDGYGVATDGTTEAVGMRIGQQTRATFGIAYLTQKGNDVSGSDYSEVLHIVYGCKASPSEASYETINDSPDAITFSWTYTCTPIKDESVAEKPIYSIEVDKDVYTEGGTNTTKLGKWTALINYIYGTTAVDPKFPLPAKVAALLA